MFQLEGYKQPVLVSSTDSVGTKVKLAVALDSYDSIGIDIVNHCVNDIFTCGASPLFFLDYIGIGRLIPDRVAAIVSGLAKACRELDCPLIGGETAEMPDIYSGDDFDLAGFVVGVVEKDKIIHLSFHDPAFMDCFSKLHDELHAKAAKGDPQSERMLTELFGSTVYIGST